MLKLDKTKKIISIIFTIVSLVILISYFLLGGYVLIFIFYGPWAGLGAHQKPPSELMTFPLWLITLVYACFAVIQLGLSPKFRNQSLHALAKQIPTIQFGFNLVIWLVFILLISTNNHKMIVDEQDPFGQNVGGSSVQISYFSQFLFFLNIPVLTISLIGTIKSIFASSLQVKLLYIISLITGVFWILLYLSVSNTEPYYY